jgi:hypothetical protein
LNREEDMFPYAMILISNKDPRDIFDKYNLKIEKIFILVEPKISKDSETSQKDSKEKASVFVKSIELLVGPCPLSSTPSKEIYPPLSEL